MSSVAGQWHSSGNWLHELASRILYVLCSWPMAFLRQIELAMSYVAEENRLANDILEEIGHMCSSRIGYELCDWLMTFLRKIGYMCWQAELGMSNMTG